MTKEILVKNLTLKRQVFVFFKKTKIVNLKSISLKKIIIHLLIASGVFVTLSYAGLIFLDSYSKHGETVEVPDLENLSEEELAKILKEKDLRYEIIDSGAYNPNIKPGGVIEQQPVALSQVKEGRRIYITVNPSSPGFVNLPNLIDKNIRRLVTYARATGLEISRIDFKEDIADFVILEIKQHGKKLKAGDKIAKGSQIAVTVGKTDDKLCSSPNVVNYQKTVAIDKILSQGLNIGTIRIDDDSKDVNPNKLIVYKQDPEASTEEELEPGRGINLWLKKKEEPKEEKAKK